MRDVRFRARGYRPIGSAIRFGVFNILASSVSANWLAQSLGDVANYSRWLTQHFGDVKRYRSREQIFDVIASAMGDHQTTVLEFGVAWGYVPNWFLTKYDSIQIWHGYDRFTGLPEKWRNLPEGSLSTGGSVPNLHDSRCVWHVGDIPEIFSSDPLCIQRVDEDRLCAFFDLDLYDPTLASWAYIRNWLRPGDLLYFDEAVDEGERRVIEENVLADFKVRALGTTFSSLCLQIVDPIFHQ